MSTITTVQRCEICQAISLLEQHSLINSDEYVILLHKVFDSYPVTAYKTISTQTERTDINVSVQSTQTPIIEDRRSKKVKDILNMAHAMGWINHHKGDKNGGDYYWFEKDGSWIPIILENHSSKRTEKGYVTTYAWKGEGDDMSKWFRPPTWDNKHIQNYSSNVKELGWDSFGKSHSRKRLDCINLNDETIKDVLKKFETIHE